MYFTTDHYRNYAYVLARLERMPRAELASLFEEAFRAKAKRRTLAAWESVRADGAPGAKRAGPVAAIPGGGPPQTARTVPPGISVAFPVFRCRC